MRWPTSSKSTPSRLLAGFLQYGTRTTLRIDRARGDRAHNVSAPAFIGGELTAILSNIQPQESVALSETARHNRALAV